MPYIALFLVYFLLIILVITNAFLAFKFLDNTNIKFDIAIAYLGPKLTPKLYQYKDKIKVLISLDFEIPDIKPKRIIDLDCGSVIYGGKKYPHKILIYEF